MTKRQVYHLLISIFFVIMGLVLSHTYRVYIYESNLFDFHLADTIGNWVAVPAAVNFYLATSKKDMELKRLVFSIVVVYIFYEFMGLVGIHGVFDWYDIAANIMSGILTYFVMKK